MVARFWFDVFLQRVHTFVSPAGRLSGGCPVEVNVSGLGRMDPESRRVVRGGARDPV
eukprot:CAMPEP_0182920018 /NCGR_PEP_ID=MMETSP0105_2-20130417/3155_1 /TAXON_ID=81532 ORGANISM="Acanthoeca-like sp., Strain 10tr" /NCGR_SAMPLE_ID=MMETSP0105_2 /ASSEMBLY_ACC=CAM_ASM_000205 /LENGTH=56 /DNA_ID=CAMNT_0025057333 /DNA_START=682 /DNA_END=852 /DNA_ORIENTATION=+